MPYQIPGIDFYDGAASGQQRKALTKISPSHVMISYATRNNLPLPFPEQLDRDYNLWWDCGAAPMTLLHGRLSETGDYVTSDADYLNHIEEYIGADGVANTLYTLRDYPVEPDVLDAHGRTVEEHQRMTIDRHLSLLDQHDDRGLDATPVATLQGWLVEDYLRHIDQFADVGILDRVGYVSIGSVCARKNDRQVANIITRVRDALPSRLKLHAFGVKRDALRFKEVLDAIDSADSNAYDTAESRGLSGRTPDDPYTFRDTLRAYLNWRGDLAETAGSERLSAASVPEQQTLNFAVTDGGRR